MPRLNTPPLSQHVARVAVQPAASASPLHGSACSRWEHSVRGAGTTRHGSSDGSARSANVYR